jgi:hypothetical protein
MPLLIVPASKGMSVDITTGYGLDDRRVEVRVPVESIIFIYRYCPDWFWGSPKLLSSVFPGVKAAGA